MRGVIGMLLIFGGFVFRVSAPALPVFPEAVILIGFTLLCLEVFYPKQQQQSQVPQTPHVHYHADQHLHLHGEQHNSLTDRNGYYH